MSFTRREFIKSVGIALASLVMTRCIPTGGGGDAPREHLRNCWLRFDWLAQQAKEADYERGERARDELLTDHRAALDDLVAAGYCPDVGTCQNHPWHWSYVVTFQRTW